MGDCDQLQLAVEDAEHLVAREIDGVDVVRDVRVGSGLAEAQVAVFLAEGEQMLQQALAMALRKRADRHPAVQPGVALVGTIGG